MENSRLVLQEVSTWYQNGIRSNVCHNCFFRGEKRKVLISVIKCSKYVTVQCVKNPANRMGETERDEERGEVRGLSRSETWDVSTAAFPWLNNL